MAVNESTSVTFFGDRRNRKQMILGIPAKAEANKPGIVCFQDVDDSGVIGNHYMWFDSSDALRHHTSIPTNQDSDGTAVGSGTGASKALDDLASVAINTSLISDTDNTDDLGSSSKEWKDLYIDGVAYIDSVKGDIAELGGATNYIKVAAAGVLTMEGTATIDGVASGNLVDKSAAETITGGWDVTTADLDIKEDDRKLTFGAAGSTDSYIKFDGTDLIFYDSNVAGTVTLSALQAGTTLSPVVTGDLTISEGKFNWTDAVDETAAAWSFANTGAGADIGITSSMTTGECIKITADATANGTFILLDADGGVGASGFYLECFDGSENDFTIGDNGEVNIKGTAATDIVTIDAGHLVITSGNATLTSGNLVLTSGNATLTAGNLALTDGNIDMAEGKIEVDSTADEISYIKRNNATGTGPVFEIEESNAAGGVALLVDSDHTGASDAMQITYAGTNSGLNITTAAVTGTQLTLAGPAAQTDPVLYYSGDYDGATNVGVIDVTSTGTHVHANTSLLYLDHNTGAPAASARGSCLRINDTTSNAADAWVAFISTTNNDGLLIDTGAVADINLKLTGLATQTGSMLSVDGTTGTGWDGATGVGMVNIAGDGAHAHANASLLNIVEGTGTTIAAARGFCLRMIDTTAAGADAWMAYMDTTNNDGLLINTGAVTDVNLKLTGLAAQTSSMAIIDGSTGTGWDGADNTGMLHLTSDSVHIHKGATMLYVANSGKNVADAEGTCARFLDTGTATASTYGVEIHSTNNTALNLTVGATTASHLRATSYEAQTTAMVTLDGSTGTGWDGADDVGCLTITHDSAHVHAGATMLRVATSGQSIASAQGTLARFENTGTARADAVMVEIVAKDETEVALNVGSGMVDVADWITAGGYHHVVTDVTATDAGLQLTDKYGFYTYDDTTGDDGDILILPPALVGMEMWLMNIDASHDVVLTPYGTEQINGLGAGTGTTVGEGVLTHLICSVAGHWRGNNYAAAGTITACT